MYLTTGASSTSDSSSIDDVRRAFLEADLHVLEVRHVLQRRAGALDDLGDRRAQLVVLDDDRLGHEVGLEADLLQRLQVGRIGDRDVELVAALVERQHAARLRDLGVDQFLLDLVEVEAREVEQRRAERAGGEDRELLRGHPLADQHLLDERHAGGLRLRLQRFGLVFGHQAVLRERARKSADVAGGGVRGHVGVALGSGRSSACSAAEAGCAQGGSKSHAGVGEKRPIPFA